MASSVGKHLDTDGSCGVLQSPSEVGIGILMDSGGLHRP